MFKRIHIKNFLSCQEIVLDNLTGVTALIGRNGSGKTNILKAIQWVVNSITSTQPIEYTFRYPPTDICFDFLLDKEYFRYQLSVAFTGSSADDSLQTVLSEQLDVQTPTGAWENIVLRQKDKIKMLGHDTEIQTGVATPSLPALIALLPQQPVVKQISKIINFLKAVRYYSLDEPNQLGIEIGSTGLVRQVDYEEWLSKYRSHPDPNTSVIMRLLHLFLHKREDYEEVKTLLGDNGLELITDIHLFPGHDYQQNAPFYFINFFPSANRDRSPPPSFNYEALSLGTRRLLRLLVSVIHDQSTVLLLEHPEDGIHIELLHKLIPLFKSYSDRGQFILASHSPEIFNRLEPQEIRLVTMAKGITYLRALDETEIATAHQFICEEGPLSDFLETIEEN